jgi:hypothetical protein
MNRVRPWRDATRKGLQLHQCNDLPFDWGGYFALRLLADDPQMFSRAQSGALTARR